MPTDWPQFQHIDPSNLFVLLSVQTLLMWSRLQTSEARGLAELAAQLDDVDRVVRNIEMNLKAAQSVCLMRQGLLRPHGFAAVSACRQLT